MKTHILTTVLFLTFFLVLSCASRPIAVSSVDINDILDRDWILTELVINNVTNRIERPAALSESFTLRFDKERYSGMAAPNRYFGPYTAGARNNISLDPPASTMMASFIEVEGLNEREYFGYLEKVTAWYLRNNTLILHTIGENNVLVVLIYR